MYMDCCGSRVIWQDKYSNGGAALCRLVFPVSSFERPWNLSRPGTQYLDTNRRNE